MRISDRLFYFIDEHNEIREFTIQSFLELLSSKMYKLEDSNKFAIEGWIRFSSKEKAEIYQKIMKMKKIEK